MSSMTSARVAFRAQLPRRVQANKAVRCAADAEVAEPKKARKKAPLETGGTLTGAAAAGKGAAASTIAAMQGDAARAKGAEKVFTDDRWSVEKGCWDFDAFKGSDGETDWNAVVDAEVRRRKILEDYPCAGDENYPVTFDLGMIPWQVWVTRFHLPEAEMVNGRASMIGLVSALMVDKIFHVSIADQFDSFLGKILLVATILGCAFVRRNEDLDSLQGLADEATFYDRQWQATWDGVERPSKEEK